MEDIRQWLTSPGADARVSQWPLVGNWKLPVALSVLYVIGIPVGKRLMRDREPFNMRTPTAVHSVILFMLSLYMTLECAKQAYENFGWRNGVRLWCNPVEKGPGFSDSGYAMARILWIHYLSKAYEFVDTLIMILKKNNRQITFLHVYHHASTFFPVWFTVVKYGPGGDAWFCCALNSAIHVFMYGYYTWAALGVRSNVVKQMVTMSQMLQFVALISQSVYMLIIKDCYRPRISPAMLLVQCTIFLLLFANFFRQSYLKPKPKTQKKTV